MNSRKRETATSKSNQIFLCSCLEGPKGRPDSRWLVGANVDAGLRTLPALKAKGRGSGSVLPTPGHPFTSATQAPPNKCTPRGHSILSQVRMKPRSTSPNSSPAQVRTNMST